VIPLLLALALLQGPAPTPADATADRRARDAALGLPGLGKPEPETKAAPPDPPKDPPKTFAGGRAARSADDFKALLDHNVFSPPRKKEPPKGDGSPKTPDAPKAKTYTLTGIVFIEGEKRYEALFEDRGAKEAKFHRAGDPFAGGTISEITFEQVTITRDAAPAAVLKVNDTITVEGVAGGPAAKPEDSSEVEKAKERLKGRHKRPDVPDEAEEEIEPRKKPKS
jgi:hypothetical protein